MFSIFVFLCLGLQLGCQKYSCNKVGNPLVGVVQSGVVRAWCGTAVVQCGVVQAGCDTGVVWYSWGQVWCGTVWTRCGVVQYVTGVVQCGTFVVWYGVGQV